ncbi:putative neuroblastoma breakpoint family member 5 isoform X2 [Lemur catta]|nr:putative neuroblastoma breakpoint family member 5 isoform X2 [Lemur catta]XP_045395293.1 putative neuroblastoma breakpoint family member 5 isoform X2 [Lemur catta]XP_045395295.1 putative neuroblastoma breakpoint family member 5 isoform X2 [Lemur catta]XP_045395296.1 putative neuroblastoma breakpoint family member 5 isoform X2 [Lemur catta]XP_045395297.1 putative neuroblastoma breakpoint family member 5 isoform X2 [Lemur catta]XP_045395298.1 putative neuroblastoma breakpoint family member 5 
MPTLEDELREANRLIDQQARELTRLRQVLREGRDGSFLLKQHLQAILLQDNPDSCQGQDLREHLAEGRRLAEHLARTLSPENHEDQEEEKEEEPPAPRLSSVEQEEKVNGVLQSQLGEGHLTSASHRDLCDTDQPPCTGAILFDEQGVSRALDAATTRGDSNTQEGQEPMETGLSGEEEEANPTQQTSLHEQRVTLSSGQDLSESRCPSRCPAARCRRRLRLPGSS